MDSSRAEKEGIAPIAERLREIDGVATRAGLAGQIAALQPDGVNALFNFFPSADPKDAAHYIAWASQGGLGMPDRDYYTKTDAASDSLRQKYVAHVAKSLTLAGESAGAAAADARKVMALETELAKASMTRVEQRDPNATYHKTSVMELEALAPAINWPLYFRTVGLTSPVAFINVAQPEFMRRASALLTTLPLEDWRAYLRYHLINAASPWLSSPFANEEFAYSSLYSGTKQMLPRWKRCLRVTDRQLGEALGQAYVARTFSPAAKAEAKQVIDDIRASFRDRLTALKWMSDSTKRYALAKLASMNEKVGYPDRWRDYSRLVVVDGPFAPNVFRANAFEWQRVRQSSRQAGGQDGMGHDRADRERVLRSIDQRDGVSRRERCCRRRSTPPVISPPTTDHSAEAGPVTSLRTASTTRGGTTTRREIFATGGRREIRCASTSRRRRSSTSSTATSRSTRFT